jgi:hypothetical protein
VLTDLQSLFIYDIVIVGVKHTFNNSSYTWLRKDFVQNAPVHIMTINGSFFFFISHSAEHVWYIIRTILVVH